MPISLIHALSSKADRQQYQKVRARRRRKNDSITFQNACKLKIVTEKNLQLRDKTRVTSTCSIKLIKELQFAIIMMTNKFLI